MRVLVCGDRFWDDREYLYAMLDAFHHKHGIDIVIEGEAPGADTMSREWAQERGIPWLPFPAQWDLYGRKRAGPIRNRQMHREGYPDWILAFHKNPSESKGTKDMVSVAMKAGLPYTWLPPTNIQQMQLGVNMPEPKATGTPGPLTPERTAVPSPEDATTRDTLPPHVDTNTVEGLMDPDAEAKAPGRPTHGANNNP